MKGFIIFILILLALSAGLFYFLPAWQSGTLGTSLRNPLSLLRFRDSSSSSSSPQTPLSLKESILTPLAKRAGNIASSTKAAIVEKTDAVGGAISQTLSDVAQGIVEGAKGKAAEALGIAPATDLAAFAAAFQSADLSICASLKGGTTVNYVLNNPFSPARDFSFRIDWGDGNASEGNLRAQDERTLASHQYQNKGTYVNSFEIKSGNQTLTIKRKLCIE